MLRYHDIPTHTTDLLDLTSLTVAEFEALVQPFEEAFLRYMDQWTLDGKHRQSRKYSTYKNCPLPTPEDRLLFILVYLKQNPLQTLQGHLFGMRQSKANQWIHILLPVLRNTLCALGDTPCRSVEALGDKLGLEVPRPWESSQEEATLAATKRAPLFAMMVPSAPSRAPKIQLNRKLAIAARKSGTWSKTSS